MFYTIYKITNKLDGKIYIGKHQTRDLNDNYMGSGKLIKRAIEKYGIENFNKEILFQFNNEADMNAKEAELVTEEFVKKETNYNLCHGGNGGFGYINLNSMNVDIVQQRLNNPSLAKFSAKLGGERKKYLIENDSEYRELCCKSVSKGLKTYFKVNPGHFNNKKHTEETKKIISEKMTELQKGSKNSQFGTMWITNNKENRKIKADDIIPEGWYCGRKINIMIRTIRYNNHETI
jgi:hypothetical protein